MVVNAKTVPAGHLRVDDLVRTGSGEKSLIRVEHFFVDMDVFEMVLEPDVAIETFFANDEPGALLSKGKRAIPRDLDYIRKSKRRKR